MSISITLTQSLDSMVNIDYNTSIDVNLDMEVRAMGRKSQIKTQDIVAMYTIQHLSSGEIQKIVGLSRPAIMQRLRKAGVSTNDGVWVKCYCAHCGEESDVVRSRWRHAKDHFCSNECYYASRENPGYFQSRQGQRIARVIVNQHFRLEPEYIVHHKDGNTAHNDLSNLSVYACQGDHIKATHHKNSTVMPIWEGNSV